MLVIFRNADAIRCRGLLRFALSGLALTGLLAGALAAEEVGIGGAIEVDTDAARSQLLVLRCFHFLFNQLVSLLDFDDYSLSYSD